MGLAICKQLTEMMGGEIRVDSTPGEGSCFRSAVRFGLQQGSMQRCGYGRGEDLAGIRMLVVDDNPSARDILESMLEAFGCSVGLASSGPEAIDEIELTAGEDAYKLILMDSQMPGMSGIDAIKKIAAETGSKV